MLIMNQNRDALVDTTSARIKIDTIRKEQSVYYRVSWHGAGMRETISEHVDLEEATSALAYIYAMAVAKQTAISMPKGTLDLEKEAASTIIANSIAETCIMGGNKNADNEPES